jgi:hypothetical protein
MSKDIKGIKAEAEDAIEEILQDLEAEGIRVFRLQVFTSRNRPPQVNIIVDEQGGGK